MEVVLPPASSMVPLISCTICHKLISDPSIYLCSKGHIYCSVCCSSTKGKKCRMNCKETLKKSFEPLLQDIYQNCRFPCVYPLCQEKILGKNLQSHQNNCHYSPIKCPDCQTVVPFEKYMEHLEKTHKIGINLVFENDSVQNISIKFPPTESYSISHYHNFQGEKFFIHVFVKPKETFLWVQYFGEIWRELDFLVRVSLRNSYGHSTEITLPINPITASFTQVYKSLTYAHFSRELLSCYLNFPQNNNNYQEIPNKRTSNHSEDNGYNNNNPVYPGFVTFSLNFSHNFLKVFRRHFVKDVQKFGAESYC